MFLSNRLPSRPIIRLTNVYVSGVDTRKRARHIKQWLMRKGTLSSDIRVPILKGVNLTIREGERVGIIGSNGSGKSSLLKVIAGIYPPCSGEVELVGKIAPLIEMGTGFDGELTGRENIKVGLLYAGRSDEYSKEFEQKIIDFTELGERIDQPFKIYSSGMRARLSFAVSVFQDPDILLLDEAFATGDAHFIDKARRTIAERFKSVPISILVSHSPKLIRQFCSRCLWMKDGRIEDDGDPRTMIELYQKEGKLR